MILNGYFEAVNHSAVSRRLEFLPNQTRFETLRRIGYCGHRILGKIDVKLVALSLAVLWVAATSAALQPAAAAGVSAAGIPTKYAFQNGPNGYTPKQFAKECIRCQDEVLNAGRSVMGYCPGDCGQVYTTEICDSQMKCHPGH